MKNFKILGLSLIAVTLLTGCGSKTLTCTKTEEDSGLKMDQEVVVKFKGDEVSNIKMTVGAEATDDLYKENWDMVSEMLESEFEATEKDGIKFTSKNDEKNYKFEVSLDVDLSKASEEDLEEYNLDDIAGKDSKIEDVKKAAEESGYTCK